MPDKEYPDKWTMHAANYMPRRGAIGEPAYDIVADTREELVDLVVKHIIPLYQNALNRLQAMCQGTSDELYYWD